MRKFTICTIALAAFLGLGRPASADATAFIGSMSSAERRQVRGFAVGVGLLVIGFEFEYADSPDDLTTAAPAVKTWMGNVLAQTPTAALQLYGTIGAGLYRESLDVRQTTGVGVNTGGGIKLKLTGPLRLRIDYRVFTFRGTPRYANPQRIYAGVNVKF